MLEVDQKVIINSVIFMNENYVVFFSSLKSFGHFILSSHFIEGGLKIFLLGESEDM